MKQYHFIGIGGVGMSALAKILLDQGHFVSGSDGKSTPTTSSLEALGAKIFIGQDAKNIKSSMCVIYSTAIKDDNSEKRQAIKLNCKMLHRSDLLEEISSPLTNLVVAGSHGKTTTSCLLAHVLKELGLDPSYAIGGFSQSLGTNGHGGGGEHFVLEGDESDGSFLRCFPDKAILTNIDFDHLYFWKSEKALLDAFKKFISNTKEDLIWYADDPYLPSLVDGGQSYGFNKKADFVLSDYEQNGDMSSFSITHDHTTTKIELPIAGRHNALNAASVFALVKGLNVEEDKIALALSKFKGVKRRFECLGDKDGVLFYDDYAHHPTEIKAAIDAAYNLGRPGKVLVIFQPHRYSRYRDLVTDFAKVLADIEDLVVLDIFSAGEKPIAGVTIDLLLNELTLLRKSPLHYLCIEELSSFIEDYVTDGDVVITLGAGDVSQIGREIFSQKSTKLGVCR